jgi:glycosyltransferase involved in cell wall biosynthesis
LNHYLRERKVAVVSCHFPETDSINFALLRRLGMFKGKFILSFHGEDIRVLNRKHRLGKWFARWMMRHADALVACSRGLMEDLVAFEPACARRATVIYNAIDIAAFRSRIDSGFALPGALRGRPFLLNVARYEHKKGHDILIRAFEKLAAEFPEVMLVTIGGSVGGESAGVRAMVEQSTARDRILMLENVPHPQVGVFLKAAQLFVLASRREGFPFVLLEAGAMQIPVAAAACLGVPEIIEDGVTGRLAPIEDADALAEAIADLLRNEEKRGQMARALHELVARDFNWTAIYRRHADLVNAGGSTD